MAFNILPMKNEDVHDVVSIHLKTLPCLFLTSLGQHFLFQLYTFFSESVDAISLVAKDEDKVVVGYIAGAINPEIHFGKVLKKRWYYFACACLGSIIKNPRVLIRLFKSLFSLCEPPPLQNSGLISQLGVLPNYQGKKIGQLLVREFLNIAKAKGKRYVYLTTDCENNSAVNKFYQKLGFLIESTYISSVGRKVNRYIYSLE